ncbi:hypothetical protein PFISCL1PPCAC_14241, partial [Pristionchus fissidentatus]
MRSGGNDNEEDPHLKEVMALENGAKSNETIDETAINAGIAEYVMGGDIAVNPHQAASLLAGGEGEEEEKEAATEAPKARRKRSLFGLSRFLGKV